MKRLHLCLPLIFVLGMLGISFLIGGGKVAASDPPPEIEVPVQQQQVLTAPSGLPSAVDQVLAGTAVVAVFDDPSYVDTENTTSSESDNVQAGLAAMGHTVVPFTGIDETAWSTALAGADVLVIPELENNSGLGNDLSLAARNVISNFVNSGGGLIEFYHGPSFLNPVFGFSLSDSGGGSSNITASAVGTAFQGGPATLPSNDATDGLDSSTFPAGGLAIYSSGGGNAEVAWLPYGAGQIVYLGWDWYDAAPPGSQDGGGLEVLERAIVQISGGMAVYPVNARGYGLPGTTVVCTYTLLNYTGFTDTYTLALNGNAWPTALPFVMTPAVPPSNTLALTVTVTVPAGASPGSFDTARLVVTSVTSPTVFSDTVTQRTMVLSGQYGYVFTQEGNQIEILDTGIHEAVGIIDTSPYGNEPFLGGLSPDGSQLYVSLWGSDSVLVVDTTTQTPFTPTIPVGVGARNMAFTPDGAYAFVPNRGSGTLSVIDTAMHIVTKTLTIGSSPMIVVTSPCLGKAYVTNRISNTVSVIDTAALTVTATITGFDNPWGIVISPYGRWAYVTNQGDGSIGVIDTTTDALIATWDIHGDWLQMLDISPDGRTLYVVDADDGAMLVVDAFSGEVLDVIPAERSEAWYVETFPAGAGDYAYFSRPYAYSVAVVDTTTQQIVKMIPLQGTGYARGLALFPMESACLAPDGVVVAPSAPHQVAPAGETVVFYEYVTNLSAVTDTFALGLSTIPWTATLSANTTGPLAPGAIFPVTVLVELPGGTPQGTLQTVTLTVTGTGVADSAALTASVLRPGFVFNQSEDVIHVVDTFYHLDSGIAIDVSAYGYQPFRGVLSPDAQQLYVGLRDGNQMLIVDTATLTPTGALLVGTDPQDVAFSPDGAWAFVTNRGDDTLTVIDTAVPTVTATLPVGDEPMSLAAACSGKLYVALLADDAVAVVDIVAMTVTKVITGFVRPHGLTLTPTCKRVYVNNQGDDSIGVIDASNDSLIATWPILGASWLSDVDVSVDGQRLYVADANTGDVYVLDTATGAVLDTVTGTGDGWVAWEVEAFPLAAGPYVYATFPYDGWVGVLDTTSNTLEKVFRLGDGGNLRGMALFPPTRLCRNVYLPLVMRSFEP
jgi:YVTN family beta-propeller protein